MQLYYPFLVVLALVSLLTPARLAAESSTDEKLVVRLLLDEDSRAKPPGGHYAGPQDHSALSFTPVLFWHGMGDTAFGSINTNRLALQRKFPGIKVFSVQIGNSAVEDELGGYFVNVNNQIESACKEILGNKIIREHGFLNAVGFSQGAQFLRGLIQRCPLRENGIRVKNLISLGGQHQGVFGLPTCNSPMFCDHIRQLLTRAAYVESVQNHLVQAEYWHDPHHEDDYKTKNIFLADINNENSFNKTYRDNLLALDNLVLVEFLMDDMVVPRESSLFGFYSPGQTARIVPMEKSDLYLADRIGLRKLDKSGRLRTISIPGRHLEYKMSWFIDEIASVYLNN